VRLLRRLPWISVPLGIFAFSRLVDTVLILLVAHRQVDASVLDPTMPMPTLVDPASYFHVIANWDGQWYRSIVEHGYPQHLPTTNGVVQENAWAFYPMFPALVWVFTLTGLSFGAAASIVSLTAGAASMCLLYRLLRARCGDFLTALTVVAICFAPAAPILQAAYSDSLGMLLLVVALTCVERRRHGWLLVTGLLLALTRPITLPLVVVTGVEIVRRWRRRETDPFPVRERWELAGVTAALVAFAGLWPAVTGLVVGDWSAYSETQHAWRVDVAGTGADTWVSSLLHGAAASRWVFVVLVVGGALLIALRSRHWTLGLRVWTAVYPLFILATTPVTFSLVRYGLMVGPAWWPFGRADGRLLSGRARFPLLAAVVVGGIVTQLIWLNWFFVITPNNRGIP
jgi:hypothetical protein